MENTFIMKEPSVTDSHLRNVIPRKSPAREQNLNYLKYAILYTHKI